MLSISVEFLHGTFRGGSSDDLALTGEADERGEWPPSPSRLYAALVAGGGSGVRCRIAEGDVGLELLESEPPDIYADVPLDVQRSQLVGRYAVIDERKEAAVHDYPARKAQLVRPGVRAAMCHPFVEYVWPDVDPTETELAALRKRAARIGYLGCADSPVDVSVGNVLSEHSSGLPVWRPDRAGDTVVPVPYMGMLADLDAAFEQWTDGKPQRRAWSPTRLVAYRDPGQSRPTEPQATCVWLRFDRAINGRRVLAVTETLRSAVLERYERQIARSRDAVPSVLHGHTNSPNGYQHVHWFALPHVAHEFADGRIRGACIWLPPGTDPDVVNGVQVVAASMKRLARAELFNVGVSLVGVTGDLQDSAIRWPKNPWSSNPSRWRRPARRWVSAFPVVHERFTKRGFVAIDEIARWCEHAGVPRPMAARLSPVPLVRGAIQLSAHEVFRSGSERRPFNHLEVHFDRPVTGPIALGRARQFGLGLMVPMAEEIDE